MVLAAVERDGRVISIASELCRQDTVFLLEALKKNPGVFCRIDPEMQVDVQFVRQALVANPQVQALVTSFTLSQVIACNAVVHTDQLDMASKEESA